MFSVVCSQSSYFSLEGKCNFCSMDTVCLDNEKQFFTLLCLFAFFVGAAAVPLVVWTLIWALCGLESCLLLLWSGAFCIRRWAEPLRLLMKRLTPSGLSCQTLRWYCSLDQPQELAACRTSAPEYGMQLPLLLFHSSFSFTCYKWVVTGELSVVVPGLALKPCTSEQGTGRRVAVVELALRPVGFLGHKVLPDA